MSGFRHGLILGIGGVRKNVLKIKPPLIINRQECNEVLEKFAASLQDILRK
ncbi:MAG: hypothetical protein PHV59_09325 [Victivallales bacterium]|nr:hypothetical protein [Victivallales bacterium]